MTLFPTQETTVLDDVYPKSAIFIERATFANDAVAVSVSCRVPADDFYTSKPIPYVTAENFVRCLSQTSYLLATHALDKRLLELGVTLGDFVAAAANYELYYRNLSMHLHERVPRGEPFNIQLTITNARRIRRMGDYVIFTFENGRTVISGEMSFVFVGHP